MSTTIPDLQMFIGAGGPPVKVLATDLGLQLESGKVRLDLIGGLSLHSQGVKVATVTATLPALPDGLQVDAMGAIVDEQDVEVTIFVAGGKSWKATGVMMTSGVTQSANAGQQQDVTIELPLNRKFK